MSTICAQFHHNPSIVTSESTVATFDFQLKKVALQSSHKTMYSFRDAGLNPDYAFIFSASYFHIMF